MNIGGGIMKFTAEKKHSIIMYILEKIDAGVDRLSAHIASTFDISPNTAHNYINQLLEQGIIEKGSRGKYRLVTKSYHYTLSRSNGDIADESKTYSELLEPLVKPLPNNIEHIWNYAFSEMVNNVIDHSEAEHMEIQILQNYLNTTVFIKDDGIGIFNKIKQHFGLADLDDAICELFKGKLTTNSQEHSGEGIFFTSKMMDTFFILSDQKIFTTNKYDIDHSGNLPDTAFQGTLVFMSLSNFSQKTAADIFNQYSDNDDGFTKTIIPLKNIFDTAPVSRSQAKRVCNNLDRFKEVVLDFDGLEWMGQGFAHQVFVVFQSSHPQISLIPCNMCASIEKMYNHVIAGTNA